MNESMDRMLDDWLREGPDRGPREGLERALAATRRVGQRPGWALPERWLPMQLAVTRTPVRRPLFAILTLAVLVAAIGAAAIVGSQPREDSPPPPFSNGAVVFGLDGDLFLVDRLGGTPRLLVADSEFDSNPVISPQGDRIAFLRWANGGEQRIMAVGVDGSGLTELTTGLRGTDVERLAWAADGSALLASANGLFNRSEWRQYVVNSDGSGYRVLDVGLNVHPDDAAWRPDGKSIAFLGQEGDGIASGAFIVEADGTNARQLPIDVLDLRGGLEWSPDGTRLGLMSIGDGIKEVTIADIDNDGAVTGSHQLVLSAGSFPASVPTWSPDGRNLAFLVSHQAELRVGIAGPDGSGHRTIGPALAPLVDTALAWSPDGRSLVISQPRQDDVDTTIGRYAQRAWLLDMTTGELTEAQTPVDSWQRLAP